MSEQPTEPGGALQFVRVTAGLVETDVEEVAALLAAASRGEGPAGVARRV